MIYDGLGRTSRIVSHEAIGTVYVDTKYDGLGRPAQISNPYLSSSGPYWTTTSYDGLSRVSAVQTSDAATVNTFYSGSQVTVRDQAGTWSQSQIDGAGRITKVIEDPVVASFTIGQTTYQNPPVGSTALNQLTSYQYDGLDNLTGVCHGGSFNSNGTCQSGLSRTFPTIR